LLALGQAYAVRPNNAAPHGPVPAGLQSEARRARRFADKGRRYIGQDLVSRCGARRVNPWEFDMNTDQAKGAVKDAAGKVQEKAGEVIGSPEQQAKGVAKQVEGKTQKEIGNAKEALEDEADKKPDDRP